MPCARAQSISGSSSPASRTMRSFFSTSRARFGPGMWAPTQTIAALPRCAKRLRSRSSESARLRENAGDGCGGGLGDTSPRLDVRPNYRGFAAMREAPAQQVWAVRDSNPRHPACKAGALPAELTARTRQSYRELSEAGIASVATDARSVAPTWTEGRRSARRGLPALGRARRERRMRPPKRASSRLSRSEGEPERSSSRFRCSARRFGSEGDDPRRSRPAWRCGRFRDPSAESVAKPTG